MKIDDGISTILTEQIRVYKILHTLLQNEKTCLLDVDAGGAGEIAKEKDTLLLRLRLLEEERIRLVRECFGEQVSLRRLHELTGDDAYLEIRSVLISLVQSIGELNEFNRVLIERSLNYFKNMANFLGCSGADGRGKGTLLSMEM